MSGLGLVERLTPLSHARVQDKARRTLKDLVVVHGIMLSPSGKRIMTLCDKVALPSLGIDVPEPIDCPRCLRALHPKRPGRPRKVHP